MRALFFRFLFLHLLGFTFSIFFALQTIRQHYFIYSLNFHLLGLFIFCFISSYSFSTLFTETNSIKLIFESIKALEIKTSIVFNLVFANNTMLSCFFFFFLIDLCFLIPAVIKVIFIAIAELAILEYQLEKKEQKLKHFQ